MANYSVVIADSALKELRRIPRSNQGRIFQRIAALAQDPRPRGSEKLTGQGRYRVRQGPYRVIYEVRDESHMVDVVKIADRKDVYR